MDARQLRGTMKYDSIHDTEAFDIENHVKRHTDRKLTFEYNCDMSRIYPWERVSDTKRLMTEFGLIWVEVKPGTAVDAHEHDEEESFCIVSGKARLILEGQSTELEFGDVVYIPRYWNHQMCNPFDSTLRFIDIYWDFRDREKSLAEVKE